MSQETSNVEAGGGFAAAPWLDAGSVAPSMKRYRIIWPHNHKTLRAGDVVVMTETPRLENMLLREPDMTLHVLQDDSDQYVHMVETPNDQALPRGN